jgi:hypothetical protein
VRVLLQEVVLHLPGAVEAEGVGELDLLQRLLVDTVLAVPTPGAGELELVKYAELHGRGLNAYVQVRVKYRIIGSSPSSGGEVG